MNNEFYRLYQDDTLRLVSSLIIKFSSVAEAINDGLLELGYKVDNERPETWKYYLHLNGEYHESDTPIRVRSADTLEDIILSKENLRTHLATARNYRWGNDEYDKLTRQYPEQRDLINGILSPVPFEKAYNAQDGDILNYAEHLVEDQEYDLIIRLQTWLHTYVERWHNPSYTLTDVYYMPAQVGLLYILLPSVLNTLRLSNTNTERANTYHIREYLRSNGRLDRYIPYLNTRQQLWLYRNIRYLVRNAGKQITFDELIYNILTVRNIPVVSYSLNHDYSKFPDELYPDVVMRKHQRNVVGLGTGRLVESVESIVDKQRGIAPANYVVEDQCLEKATRGMAVSAYSSLPTKVLESEAVDHSDSGVAILANTLMNHWIYMGYTGQYRSYVTVSNPITGERLTLTTRDAFVMMWYCRFKSWGRDVTELPVFTAFDIQTPKPATIDELRPYVDWRDVTDDELLTLQNHFTPYGEIISIENFYDTCVNIHNGIIDSWQYVCSKEHLYTFSYLRQARLRNYMNVVVDFRKDAPNYTQWFTDRNIDLSMLDKEDYATLMRSLISTTTGSSLQKTVSFAELQERLLELLQKLCSYSVQFLQTISFTNFFVIGGSLPRLIDYRIKAEGTTFDLNIPSVDAIGLDISSSVQARGVKVVAQIDTATKIGADIKAVIPVTSDISIIPGVNVQRITLGAPTISLNQAIITATETSTTKKPTLHEQYKALYTDYGPGPSVLCYGDISQGYFGSVNAEGFITPDTLKSVLGVTSGESNTENITFYKFYLNGDVVYIPNRDFFSDIDVKEWDTKGIPKGVTVTIGEHQYLVKAPCFAPYGKGTYSVEYNTENEVSVSVNGFTPSQHGIMESEFAQTLLTVATDLRDDNINSVPTDMIDGLPTLADLHLPWTGQSLSEDTQCIVGGDNLEYKQTYPDSYNTSPVSYTGVTVGGMLVNEDTRSLLFTHCLSVERVNTMKHVSFRPYLVLKK